MAIVTHYQNVQNRRILPKGAHYDRHSKKWRARIWHEGKRYTFGWFNTEKEAVQEYQKAKVAKLALSEI